MIITRWTSTRLALRVLRCHLLRFVTSRVSSWSGECNKCIVLCLFTCCCWCVVYCVCLLGCCLVRSYIMSWKMVPRDFTLLDGSTLNNNKVKGWLFKNLPEKHAHRYGIVWWPLLTSVVNVLWQLYFRGWDLHGGLHHGLLHATSSPTENKETQHEPKLANKQASAITWTW